MKTRLKIYAAILVGFVLGNMLQRVTDAQTQAALTLYNVPAGGYQSVSLGPQTAAQSVPVVLPSDQTSNAAPGNVPPPMSTTIAGVDQMGKVRTVAVDTSGTQFVLQQPTSQLPLPQCNPVRNYSCQPKGF